MMPYYYGYGAGMDWGWGWGLLSLVWQVLVIVFIIWIIRRIFFGRGRMSRGAWWHTHSGLEILNERYAKGEITKEEYEERKKTLLS